MTTKKPFWPIILSLFAFFILLFLGLKVGERIFYPSSVAQAVQGTPTASANTAENIWLLIYVDDLTVKKPRLEGVWLANFQSQQPALLFLPVLPSQADDGEERDKDLAASFSLNQQNQPDQKFLDTLAARNLAWGGYIIIDQSAASAIIDYLDGIDLGNGLEGGNQVVGDLRSRTQDRPAAQHDQARLLLGACHRAAEIRPDQPSFSQLLMALPQHLSAGGIPPSAWENEWQDMKSMGNITCQAPTLPNLR